MVKVVIPFEPMSDFELLSSCIKQFSQQGLPPKKALQKAIQQWRQQRIPDLKECQLL